MMIQILKQLLNTKWLMEPAAAKQWAGIAAKFINGDLTAEQFANEKERIKGSVPVKWDVRRGTYYQFLRADENGNYATNGPVQIVMIDGPIMKYDYCGAAGTITMGQAIMAANQDDSVKSIVLYVDSPGGSVDGTEALANIIRNSDKPVVAYVNSMMASAAYWIGSGAKMIVSDGSNKGFNATIGSIGTMASWIDRKGQYEKEGAVVHEVYATDSTDKNADYREMNKGNYTSLIQDVLDPLNDTFLNAVKENRSGKLDLSKENVLTGKTYNAKEAMKYGLIDKIGSFEMAIKESLTLAKKYKKMENSLTAFTQTLASAKAEHFEVVEGGFLLSEENLNNIEAAINTLSQRVAEAESNASNVAENAIGLQSSLDTANANLATANARIADLEAQVETLNAQTPAPAATSKDADKFNEEDPETKYLTSYDLEKKAMLAKMK